MEKMMSEQILESGEGTWPDGYLRGEYGRERK